MNRRIVALLLISAGLYLSACQKNSDIFVPDPSQINGPDTNWYSVIAPTMPVSSLKEGLATEVYTDSIQVNSNTAYITTPFGLLCGFPPHCCAGNSGQTITGTVKVDLMLVKKKGDMIKQNRPTTSNNRLLVSAGEIFVRLKQNNQDLQLAPGVKITLRFPDAPINTQMRFFAGDETNPQQFNWLPNPDQVNNTIGITSQNYEVQTNRLRWVGVEYIYDTTGIALTTVTTQLDPQFTNANTIVYAVFKDYRSVVALNGDLSTRKFSSVKLPVGKEITVIVLSKQGNDYFMDHKTVTTVSSASTPGNQTVQVKPVITTLANIKTYLDTL